MPSPALPESEKPPAVQPKSLRLTPARRLALAAAVVVLPVLLSACTDNAKPASSAGTGGPSR